MRGAFLAVLALAATAAWGQYVGVRNVYPVDIGIVADWISADLPGVVTSENDLCPDVTDEDSRQTWGGRNLFPESIRGDLIVPVPCAEYLAEEDEELGTYEVPAGAVLYPSLWLDPAVDVTALEWVAAQGFEFCGLAGLTRLDVELSHYCAPALAAGTYSYYGQCPDMTGCTAVATQYLLTLRQGHKGRVRSVYEPEPIIGATISDYIAQDGGTDDDAMYIVDQSADNFQHDDPYSVAWAAKHDSAGGEDTLFGIFRDSTSTQALVTVETDSSGYVNLTEGFSAIDDTTTSPLVDDAWNRYCLRSSGSDYSVSIYSSEGVLIERLTGVDSASVFSGADTAMIMWGAEYYGATAAINQEWWGGHTWHAIWGGEDIGTAGCDAWAADPLTYSITTNTAEYFSSTDASSDITVATTVQDQGANNRDFTLSGDAALSEAGTPTVTGTPTLTADGVDTDLAYLTVDGTCTVDQQLTCLATIELWTGADCSGGGTLDYTTYSFPLGQSAQITGLMETTAYSAKGVFYVEAGGTGYYGTARSACVNFTTADPTPPDPPAGGRTYKWHPGNYAMYVDARCETERVTSALAFMAGLADEEEIVGFAFRWHWYCFEGATANNWSDGFAKMDSILDLAESMGKQVIFEVWPMNYGRCTTANSTNGVFNWPLAPAYVRNTAGWLSYCDSHVRQWIANRHVDAVTDRLIALSVAYANRYDEHPALEAWGPDDESISMYTPGVQDLEAFTWADAYANWTRWYDESYDVWENTMLIGTQNWAQSDEMIRGFYENYSRAGICMGTTDGLPEPPDFVRRIPGQTVFRGSRSSDGAVVSGWTDYRTQNQCWIARMIYGQFMYDGQSPTELYNFNYTTMRASHMLWNAQTYYTADPGQNWTTSVLPFIQTGNADMYYTACPPGWTCD